MKTPSVEHKYHPKKDRLEIRIKHYALGKKSERQKIVVKLLRELERNPELKIAKAKDSKKKGTKLPKSPAKDTKLPLTGD